MCKKVIKIKLYNTKNRLKCYNESDNILRSVDMRREGFRLYAILRVLGISGLIIGITGFLLLNIIDKIRKKTFTDISYGIVSAAEYKYAHEVLTGSSGEMIFKFDDEEEFNEEGKTLDYKGDKPKYGIIKVNNIGQVFIALYDGKYCSTKDFEEADITITKKRKKDCYDFE